MASNTSKALMQHSGLNMLIEPEIEVCDIGAQPGISGFIASFLRLSPAAPISRPFHTGCL
jgi:hypothetical protein